MRKGAGVWHPTVDDSLPNGSRPPKACVQKRRCTWKNVRTCGCDEDRLVTGGTSPKRFTTNRLTTLKQEIWIYVSCIKINYLLLLNQFAWICMHTLYIYMCVFFYNSSSSQVEITKKKNTSAPGVVRQSILELSVQKSSKTQRKAQQLPPAAELGKGRKENI